MSHVAARLRLLNERIISCRRCPRLTEYRVRVAENPPRRFRGQSYWAKPLPGFGDPLARVLAVGLAPAAHGGNRTGRMFTGDSAGNTLMKALHATGFSNQPYSLSLDDGLQLRDIYLTAVVRCPPPANKPLPEEIRNCSEYLLEELKILPNIRVIVALGGIAYTVTLRILRENGVNVGRPMPRFRHGLLLRPSGEFMGRKPPLILASYHPSRQNTQTGRLTQQMLNQVFEKARNLAETI